MNWYGFTLIEMVIYLGVFSILLIGAIGIFYSSATESSKEHEAQLENYDGLFVSKKIDWALTQATRVILPSPNSTSTSLELQTEQGEILFSIDPHTRALTMHENGQNPEVLTTKSFQISEFKIRNSSYNAEDRLQIEIQSENRGFSLMRLFP